MPSSSSYIIVGGGLAGASAIEGIRTHDPSGSITLFAKENHLPYDRPPLSKGLWLGKTTLEDVPVHPREFYREQNVTLHLNAPVMKIDGGQRTVLDNRGESHRYDKLLLVTGGSPRRIPNDQGLVQYYRTVDDYLMLRKVAAEKKSFLVIGGGFIGGELAAALRLQEREVTMLLSGDRILQNILPADLAAFVTGYYRERGVRIIHGDHAAAFARSGGRIAVTTQAGKTIEADHVVAGVGISPNTELAGQAGLALDNGIRVNDRLQTSRPEIYAAGDVAFFPAPSLEKSVRIEHWNNGQVQGRWAGENMAGADKPYEYLPYFYSDLFDLGFEAVGDLRSDLETFADWKEVNREGVIYYLRSHRVVGILLWNVWEKVDAARALIEEKKNYSKLGDLRGRI